MAIGEIREVVSDLPTLIEAVVMLGRAALPRTRILGLDLPTEAARELARAILRACDRAEELAAHFEDGLPGTPTTAPLRRVR